MPLWVIKSSEKASLSACQSCNSAEEPQVEADLHQELEAARAEVAQWRQEAERLRATIAAAEAERTAQLSRQAAGTSRQSPRWAFQRQQAYESYLRQERYEQHQQRQAAAATYR